MSTYGYLWLIHVDVWQRPSECCEIIILQFKKKKAPSLTLSMLVREVQFGD